MTTTSADELLKGCLDSSPWDDICGKPDKVDGGVYYCGKCQAKIAQSLAEKKYFFNWLKEVFYVKSENNWVSGFAMGEYYSLGKEIKKLERVGE